MEKNNETSTRMDKNLIIPRIPISEAWSTTDTNRYAWEMMKWKRIPSLGPQHQDSPRDSEILEATVAPADFHRLREYDASSHSLPHFCHILLSVFLSVVRCGKMW